MDPKELDLEAFKYTGPLMYTKVMISENNRIDDIKNENNIAVDEDATNMIANVDADPLNIETPPAIEVVRVLGRAPSRRGRPKIIDPVKKEFFCDICNAKFDQKRNIKTHLEL